ncbi:MAG: DUF2520 domain-containing protein [Chloroflexota bacterium]
MEMIERPTLAIVGAGRVGSTLAQVLHNRGYTISAVNSRTPESARHLAEKLGCHAADTPREAALEARLTLLTVTDEAIASVCEVLARDTDLTGRAVVHTSGISEIAVLAAAKASGAWVGGLHPMLPIMDRDLSPSLAFSPPSATPDVMFGVEAAEEPLRSWLAAIVTTLNGIPLWLSPGQDRARYHAASVIASNYAVTLFAESLTLLKRLQASKPKGQSDQLGQQSKLGVESSYGESGEVDERLLRFALVHLVQATLTNIKEVGAVQALTGPIARGDVQTVHKHLVALQQTDPELATLYRLLGKRTLRLAAERGLSAQKLDGILKNLETDTP